MKTILTACLGVCTTLLVSCAGLFEPTFEVPARVTYASPLQYQKPSQMGKGSGKKWADALGANHDGYYYQKIRVSGGGYQYREDAKCNSGSTEYYTGQKGLLIVGQKTNTVKGFMPEV